MNDPLKYPGKLITFEGLDGCGKSTQLEREAGRLRGLGLRVRATREPGGTPVGRQIRDLVLNASSDSLTDLTELTLMFAARAQHVEQVILPALQAGEIVLSDRFTDSTVAYQGYGRGIALDTIRSLEALLCQGVRPDGTLLLEIDVETGLRRAQARNDSRLGKESRFENETLEFFHRVEQGYREIARREPGRVRVVDGRGSIAEVQERVARCVDEFLSAFRQRVSDVL